MGVGAGFLGMGEKRLGICCNNRGQEVQWERAGGGRGGNVATEVCDLVASCPDYVTGSVQT